MDNFADILFRGEVKSEQIRKGSSQRFEKAYANRFRDGLGPDEIAFIETRDTFYMATVSEDGWPYVQHRGGPVGFLKVIGTNRLGMADYTGNAQYISMGHLKAGSRISLILMDYPRRARLKILGVATMVDASKEALKPLSVEGQGPVERILEIEVTAFDWNCPKYITQRFDEGEIQTMLGPRIAELDHQVGVLADRLKQLGEDPAALLKKETP